MNKHSLPFRVKEGKPKFSGLVHKVRFRHENVQLRVSVFLLPTLERLSVYTHRSVRWRGCSSTSRNLRCHANTLRALLASVLEEPRSQAPLTLGGLQGQGSVLMQSKLSSGNNSLMILIKDKWRQRLDCWLSRGVIVMSRGGRTTLFKKMVLL